MPFGPIRVPRISRPTGIGAVGSSSSMNIPANNGFHLNVGRRSLGRKAKQRYLHAPMSIPDYGSMTTASGAETPQRLEDVTEVSEELRPGSSLSEQNHDRIEDSMIDEDEVDICELLLRVCGFVGLSAVILQYTTKERSDSSSSYLLFRFSSLSSSSSYQDSYGQQHHQDRQIPGVMPMPS